MNKTLLIAVVVGALAAVASVAVQKLLFDGESSAAVAGGVAGAVTAVVVSANRSKEKE